jgi:hypothetical protein
VPREGERRPFYFKAGAEIPALLIPPSFRETILEARFPGTIALDISVDKGSPRLSRARRALLNYVSLLKVDTFEPTFET